MIESEASHDQKAPALPLVLAALPGLYDAYVFVGIRGGRDAFLGRVGEPSFAFGLVGLVALLVGLVGHALLALRVARAQPVAHTRGHISAGNRRLQQGSALVLLVFFGLHSRHSVFVAGLEGLGAAGLYERIRNDCDGYPWLAVYLLGLAALALHLGQGLHAIASRGRYAPESTRRVLASSAVVLAVVTFILFTDALAAYALGAPLFSGR